MSVNMEHPTPQATSACISDPNINFSSLLEDILVKDDNQKWDCIIHHIKYLNEKISDLQTENTALKTSIATANGKITFLEKQIDKTKTKLGELEWKALQKDIVLYNLPEDQKTDREMLIEFLTEHLKLSQHAIHSAENAKGSIQIDTTLRIGRKIKEKARPLIVSFALLSSKKIIMEQYRKLQLSSPVRITDHYPSEMREKRSVQKDTLKKYRDIYRNSDKTVKLVKDKLIVGTKVSNEAFAVNPLTSSPQSIPQNQSDIEHTFTKEENGSCFQGHASKVGSITEAASAKDALFQLPTVTQCDHIILPTQAV